jgi:hypothetical protein
MGLQPYRRHLVVFRSHIAPAGRYGDSRYRRLARTGRIGRLVRIGVLFTVVAVRPRWRPLLAGAALTVFGVIERHGVAGVLIVPGLLFLWHALLTPGDPDADRQRRTRLERELAAFSTPTQRCDLEAMLDRNPDAVTGEIRDILAGQAMASRNTGIPGTRSY